MKPKPTIADLIRPCQLSPSSHRLDAVQKWSAQHGTLLHGGDTSVDPLTSLMRKIATSDTTPKVVKAVAWLLFEHGLRITEVLNIQKCDISRQGRIRIKGLKGSNDRIVTPIMFAQFWQSLPDFMLPLGSVYSRFYFYRWFKRIGIYDVFGNNKRFSVTHMFRHHLALSLKNEFDDTALTQRVLGHRSIKSTLHYEKERKRGV